MDKHTFIFQPGVWIGEGRITFNVSPEILRFFTKWVIEPLDQEKGIVCYHYVELPSLNDNKINNLTFFDITPTDFSVLLENNLVGQVAGKGFIEPHKIAWEFRGHPDMEGFEVYELQEDGDYMIHAEYTSTDQYRTIIDGRIWKKS